MKWICYILFIPFCFLNAHAQEASIDLDSNVVLIGDHISLDITVMVPEKSQLQWHSLDSAYANIEILNQSSIDTVKLDGHITYHQKINLIPFDSGFYALEPIEFPMLNDGEWDTIRSNALALKVETIPVDTTKAIMPIKPPIDIPWHWKDALPYAYGFLGFAALIGLIFWLLKRKRETPTENQKPVDNRLPHEIALEKLSGLEGAKLWQQRKIKDYYVNLTYILREYIENRFETDALESTTDEILASLKEVPVKATLKERLKNILNWADLVKFAKASPTDDLHTDAMKTVKRFVLKTANRKEVEV